MHLMVVSRPDLTFAVGKLARFMHEPYEVHMIAAKRVLRYLKGTTGLSLLFRRGGVLVPVVYADADFAGDISSRRSTSGLSVFLGESPVVWKSRRQSMIALSTGEAEYISLCDAAKMASWIRQLFCELGFEQKQPTVIFEDNQACIKMAENPVVSQRTKHIDIQYHYVRECVLRQSIEIRYIESAKQLADLHTKALARVVFERLRKAHLVLPSEGEC